MKCGELMDRPVEMRMMTVDMINSTTKMMIAITVYFSLRISQ